MRKQCLAHSFELAPEQFDLRLVHLRTPLPAAVEQMTAALKKHGQLTPVIAAGDTHSPMLIDGFKRHRAARILGLPSLRVSVVMVEAAQAKALMYLMNRGRGFSLVCEAMLVRELVEIDGFNQSEAASMLERHKSWVTRRLELIRQLAPEVCEELKLELLPPGSAPSLARLPRCNQADFAATIQTHGLAAGEVRRLVELWCKAKEPTLKQFLLDSPRQALEIVKQHKEETPAARWQQLLQGMTGLVQRLENDLRTMAPAEATRLEALLGETQQLVMAGLARLRLHLTGAGNE